MVLYMNVYTEQQMKLISASSQFQSTAFTMWVARDRGLESRLACVSENCEASRWSHGYTPIPSSQEGCPLDNLGLESCPFLQLLRVAED